MSSGLTATGLLLLLLAFIGSGVGLYYAYVCLQARPLRPKKHKDAECGPLIPPDPDVNGNHEDVPNGPSAPLHEDATNDLKLHPDLPDQDTTSPNSQGSDSSKPPKDKEDVLVTVEDDVPPAKVMHEKETAPATNQAAPLGFVVPTPTPSPQEAPLDHHPVPKNIQSQPEKTESPPSTSSAPVPVYIPSPPQKKTIAISDEEDGLLRHEPAPQDDSLNSDLCDTLPASHSPQKPCQREEPVPTTPNNPTITPSRPEEVAPLIPPRQPTAVPRVENVPKQEVQPVVAMLPQTAPTCPEKEELKPVGKAVDTLPSEIDDEPALVCMKDDERLPSEVTSNDLNKGAPIPTPDEVPIIKSVSPESLSVEPKNLNEKETAVESDDSLSTADPSESTEPTLKAAEKIEAPRTLSENEQTEPAPKITVVHEEPRSSSSCSESSEGSLPPYQAPVSDEVKSQTESEPAPPLEPCHPELNEDEKRVKDISASPETLPHPSSDIPSANTAEDSSSSLEGNSTPSEPAHVPADELDSLSDAPSDVSEAVDSLTVPSLTTANARIEPSKEATATPSRPPADIPIDASNIPMEAYTVVLDDSSDEDGTPLPVIKEEGSLENNSEGTETDSSEPEVTEYSFSSGPSAPSTTGVLANEVSCILEPKVTKFSHITDLDASGSEDIGTSDDDFEEEDVASSPKPSNDKPHNNSNSTVENKDTEEEKQAEKDETSSVSSDDLDTSKRDSVPNMKASNGPVDTETIDPATSEISDSDDTDTESEGAEAEVELKEEVVNVPAVVCEKTTNHTTTPSPTDHAGSPAQSCTPKPSPPKPPKGNNDSLEEIPSAIDDNDDGLSLSPSESCDLLDGEVTTSTPKKSMIPKLVKHSEV